MILVLLIVYGVERQLICQNQLTTVVFIPNIFVIKRIILHNKGQALAKMIQYDTFGLQAVTQQDNYPIKLLYIWRSRLRFYSTSMFFALFLKFPWQQKDRDRIKLFSEFCINFNQLFPGKKQNSFAIQKIRMFSKKRLFRELELQTRYHMIQMIQFRFVSG